MLYSRDSKYLKASTCVYSVLGSMEVWNFHLRRKPRIYIWLWSITFSPEELKSKEFMHITKHCKDENLYSNENNPSLPQEDPLVRDDFKIDFSSYL